MNTITEKEKLLGEHYIARRLTKTLKSSLLHEMLEEHFLHGHTLVKKGDPAKTVLLIKSGFARIYLDVCVPKAVLPEAVQHRPSTELQQRNKRVQFEMMDVGAGEFVGGLEQLCGEEKYMFTVVATCDTVVYNMRSEKFAEIVLRPNSRTLQLMTSDLKTKFAARRELADLSVCPKTDRIIARLVDGEKSEEEKEAERLETLKKCEPIMKKRSIPSYMLQKDQTGEKGTGSATSYKRPANRGPFADRYYYRNNSMARVGKCNINFGSEENEARVSLQLELSLPAGKKLIN
eukprot:sb/3467651/